MGNPKTILPYGSEIRIIASAHGSDPTTFTVEKRDFEVCREASKSCCIPGQPALDFSRLDEGRFLKAAGDFIRLKEQRDQAIANVHNDPIKKYAGTLTVLGVVALVVGGAISYYGHSKVKVGLPVAATGLVLMSIAVWNWVLRTGELAEVDATFKEKAKKSAYAALPRVAVPLCPQGDVPPYLLSEDPF